MNVRISSIHFTADSKLRAYIEKKLSKLEQVFDRIVSVDVTLKLENTGQIRDKIVDLKVKVPNRVLLASESHQTFETAADKSVDNMTRQVRKYKEKLTSKHS